jgi:cell division protein FtsB
MEQDKISSPGVHAESHSESRSQFGIWGIVLILLLGVAVLSLGFMVYERAVAKQLSTQNAAMSAALDQTRSQLQDVTSKLNQLSEAQAAAEAARAAQRSASPHRRPQARRDDPRWKQVQDELAEHQQAIASAQSDLLNTRTELSGSIARTHEELVALARKGERNYYEFDLSKSKQFTREGPIGVSLRKANEKHVYADLELQIDDAQVTKKHVNVFEPVSFYTSHSKQPVELVINQVSKDHIHGYVSTAKYQPSDLPALSGLTEGGTAQSAGASAASSSPPGAPQLRSRAQR